MKREIKFRGKSKKDGEWFFGNLFDKDTRGNTHISTTSRGCLDVDPNTVGQYTGLKDKNGVEIYEGDIIMSNSSGEAIYHLISYNEEKAAFYAYMDGVRKGTFGICNLEQRWIYIFGKEVIGNIYDNPELLKGDII